MNEDEVTVFCWVVVIGFGEGYAFEDEGEVESQVEGMEG